MHSIEVLSHIRYQNLNQGLGGIHMAELQKNMVLFFYGGLEVQGNIIIEIICINQVVVLEVEIVEKGDNFVKVEIILY